jgi:hypothetical protein
MFKNKTMPIGNPTTKIMSLFKEWLLASGKDDFAKDARWPEKMRKLRAGRQDLEEIRNHTMRTATFLPAFLVFFYSS